MTCTCGSKTVVRLTYSNGMTTWRLRECVGCHRRFSTQEVEEESPEPIWKMLYDRRRVR